VVSGAFGPRDVGGPARKIAICPVVTSWLQLEGLAKRRFSRVLRTPLRVEAAKMLHPRMLDVRVSISRLPRAGGENDLTMAAFGGKADIAKVAFIDGDSD